MPIYPVNIKEWYTDPYKEGDMSGFGKAYKRLKSMLPSLRCEVCGGQVKERYGWVMHSITFGGPHEAFCSKRCLERWYKGEINGPDNE